MDSISEYAVDLHSCQRRGLVQISDDLSAQQPKMVHVAANGLPGQPESTTCCMNGRKQATSLAPGGRSFSHPIQERGQFSKSRQ